MQHEMVGKPWGDCSGAGIASAFWLSLRPIAQKTETMGISRHLFESFQARFPSQRYAGHS